LPRRDVQHEGEPPGVEQPVDVAHPDHLGALEIGRQEILRNGDGQLRPVLVRDGDGGVVDLLRRVLRHGDDGEGERVDYQSEHEVVAEQAS
jgi:hypothetical protein